MKKFPADCALLVIDVQNGFCSGGGLPVPEGESIVPLINQLAQLFEYVVLTQDWHPDNHVSFVKNHLGAAAFSSITLPYGEQTLWPTHCVQGTVDAALHPDLKIDHAQLIVRKGYHQAIDSYSAFLEADKKTTTGLGAYLKALGIQKVYLVGLATDFCVAWTALDARKLGFECVVIEDATRAIDLNGSLDSAKRLMQAASVECVQSQQILPNIATKSQNQG